MVAEMGELPGAEGVSLGSDAGPAESLGAEELAEVGAGALEPVGPVDWLVDGAEPATGTELLVDTCDCGL